MPFLIMTFCSYDKIVRKNNFIYDILNSYKGVKKMKNKRILYGILCSLIVLAVMFYIFLPPLNITSLGFWIYFWIGCIPLLIACVAGAGVNKITKGSITKIDKAIMIIFSTSMVLVMVIMLASSSIFHAQEYGNRIDLVESPFSDIPEVDFTKTAIIDRDSTLVLGDRTLGQLPELISQFDVSDIYTQISYQDTIIRVTPLDYNGAIKYFTNRSEGVPAYITVNATNGKSDLIKLSDLGLNRIRYTENAMFFEDRDRHLRFAYPTEIFAETNFEIDEQGVPYWITSTIKYKGISQKPMISGVIAMNAIDGSMTKYEVGNIPEWIDRVYPSELIIEQVNQSGAYIHGFWNSMFGQRDVYKTTEGYNYIGLNDDIWLYTGITSANADESNIGFVLINQRTHEAKKIMSPGAEEFSAMSSAQGKVQNLGYNSTFPLLINVSGRPTYLVSLKDNAGLVKMYAMIDCEDYQRVVTVEQEQGLPTLKREYQATMNIIDTDTLKKELITIAEVSEVNIDGNTYYFMKDEEGHIYRANITISQTILPFIKENEKYQVVTTPMEDLLEIIEIEKVQ